MDGLENNDKITLSSKTEEDWRKFLKNGSIEGGMDEEGDKEEIEKEVNDSIIENEKYAFEA